MSFQDDLSLGDGAGLIRAKHVHCAKILNGIQPFDDHFLL